MAREESKKSLTDTLLEESAKPLTFKDRIVGILMSLGFIAVGVGMLLWPDFLSFDDEGQLRRNGAKIKWLLEVVWSRPVGVILILLALLMIWGSLTKKGVEKPTATP